MSRGGITPPDEDGWIDELPGPKCAEEDTCIYCGRDVVPAEQGMCWACFIEPPAGVTYEPNDLTWRTGRRLDAALARAEQAAPARRREDHP